MMCLDVDQSIYFRLAQITEVLIPEMNGRLSSEAKHRLGLNQGSSPP
jgi:hypothetical protein